MLAGRAFNGETRQVIQQKTILELSISVSGCVPSQDAVANDAAQKEQGLDEIVQISLPNLSCQSLFYNFACMFCVFSMSLCLPLGLCQNHFSLVEGLFMCLCIP